MRTKTDDTGEAAKRSQEWQLQRGCAAGLQRRHDQQTDGTHEWKLLLRHSPVPARVAKTLDSPPDSSFWGGSAGNISKALSGIFYISCVIWFHICGNDVLECTKKNLRCIQFYLFDGSLQHGNSKWSNNCLATTSLEAQQPSGDSRVLEYKTGSSRCWRPGPAINYTGETFLNCKKGVNTDSSTASIGKKSLSRQLSSQSLVEKNVRSTETPTGKCYPRDHGIAGMNLTSLGPPKRSIVFPQGVGWPT